MVTRVSITSFRSEECYKNLYTPCQSISVILESLVFNIFLGGEGGGGGGGGLYLSLPEFCFHFFLTNKFLKQNEKKKILQE